MATTGSSPGPFKAEEPDRCSFRQLFCQYSAAAAQRCPKENLSRCQTVAEGSFLSCPLRREGKGPSPWGARQPQAGSCFSVSRGQGHR